MRPGQDRWPVPNADGCVTSPLLRKGSLNSYPQGFPSAKGVAQVLQQCINAFGVPSILPSLATDLYSGPPDRGLHR